MMKYFSMLILLLFNNEILSLMALTVITGMFIWDILLERAGRNE